MYDPKLIGERIKSRREEIKMTLGDIATAVHVAESTVQRYEVGSISRIKLPVIQSIAAVLQVRPEWLLGFSNEKEVKKEAPVDTVDEELREYLDELRSRPEQRMLFSVTKHATKAQIEAIVKMVEEMQGNK